MQIGEVQLSNWDSVSKSPGQKHSSLPFCRTLLVSASERECDHGLIGSGLQNREELRHGDSGGNALQCEKKEYDEGRLKLGGPGKVVEVDEMHVCHRKYQRGRLLAKKGVWVLGLTEVDSASHPIEDPRLLERLKDQEDKRKKAADERAQRKRKRAHIPNQPFPTTPLPSPFATQSIQPLPSPFATSNPFASKPVLSPPQQIAPRPQEVNIHETDGDDDDDPVDVVRVGEDDDDSADGLSRVAFENQMKRLFSRSRKNATKKTLR